MESDVIIDTQSDENVSSKCIRRFFPEINTNNNWTYYAIGESSSTPAESIPQGSSIVTTIRLRTVIFIVSVGFVSLQSDFVPGCYSDFLGASRFLGRLSPYFGELGRISTVLYKAETPQSI